MSFNVGPGVFAPSSDVTALLESDPVVIGRFRALADGSVSGAVRIPQTTVTGWHVFRLSSDSPDASVGVSIYVQGTATTPTPTPRPTHRPGKPGNHHEPGRPGHGDHRYDSLQLAAAVKPTNSPYPNEDSQGLAATGSDQALVIGGTATALLLAGGGSVLAVRRRRSS
ncbi:hypothetical protein [Streptomyces sp. NPDC086787]|uniref:hypothetical protein n=1 Tax=Streptomyces sp. NPDC086787 TaxID=3365759 RepID=UPI00380AA011